MKPLYLACLSAFLCIILFFPNLAHAQHLPDSANACRLLKISFDFKSVQRNAAAIVSKSDEECTLKFIDQLVDGSSGVDHHQYLACLDALCRVSDGNVAKDFDSVCAKLFHKNFNNLFEYIYKPTIAFKTRFEQTIIEGVGLELSSSSDQAAAKTDLVTYVRQKEQEMKMNPHQKAFAEALKDKILAYKAN